MRTQHLHEIWTSPDNTRLTTKQFSFRFPVHIAAKIAALCEMYPHKSRTHIVADLLAAALEHLERSLPEESGERVSAEEEHADRMLAELMGEPYEAHYKIGGPRGHFRYLANKHYGDLERELGNENSLPLYEQRYGTEKHFKEGRPK
jgi:hypothetical protein